MSITKHEDHWERFWGEGIGKLRNSFLADHYNYVQRIAKRLSIGWPEQATILKTKDGGKTWQLLALAAVIYLIEAKLNIKYQAPKHRDVETDEGLERLVMSSLCERIKAIDAKLS